MPTRRTDAPVSFDDPIVMHAGAPLRFEAAATDEPVVVSVLSVLDEGWTTAWAFTILQREH